MFDFDEFYLKCNKTIKHQIKRKILHKTIQNNWLLDSGASHYVTNDLNAFSFHTPYDGNDELLIGDGTLFPISHIGSMALNKMQHVLATLISVDYFSCTLNPCKSCQINKSHKLPSFMTRLLLHMLLLILFFLMFGPHLLLPMII